MRHTIRILLLGVLAWSLAACVQGDGPPQEPFDDGMEELVAAAESGGWIEASLTVEFSDLSAASHPAGDPGFQDLHYLRAAFELRTAEGHPLRAIGLLWHPDGDALSTELSPAGPLRISGLPYAPDGLRAIRATADLDLTGPGGPVTARASLFIVAADALFDEADALFFGDAQLLPQSEPGYSDGTVFPYSAASDKGAYVGLLLGDGFDLKLGEEEVRLSYVAERWTTPFGAVQWLSGFVESGGKQVPAVALALDLQAQQRAAQVVLLCEGCLGDERDVALTVPLDGFTATDDLWLKMPYLPGVPAWAAGRALTPLPEKFGCDEVLELAGVAVWGANVYIKHHNALAHGAYLATVDKAVTLHAPGTPPHEEAILRLHAAELGAWDTATFLLKHVEELSCF